MRYLSVCSGIEAATVAWHPLGWEPAAFSDIEAFPRAVLRHHYPNVPLHGRERTRGEGLADYAVHAGFQTIQGDEYGAIDLLVGGTPCQSFSIAGLRGGLADERGNLALEYLRLARRSRARWLVWENVRGVLSSGGGRDFGAILGGMAELGYGFAYRVLDAQYFGVPQRRGRVFVVGYLGDWRRAAAVLLERQGLSGAAAPSRKARQVAPTLSVRTAGGGGLGTDFDLDGGVIACAFGGGNTRGPLEVAGTLHTKGQRIDYEADTFIAQGPVWAFSAKDYGGDALEDCSPTLRAGGHASSHPNSGAMPAVADARFGVRRLTPRECERLQGFPDDYTKIPWRGRPSDSCPDGPRYKALGNSMAVPVMRWIGERIAAVEAMDLDERAAA